MHSYHGKVWDQLFDEQRSIRVFKEKIQKEIWQNLGSTAGVKWSNSSGVC